MKTPIIDDETVFKKMTALKNNYNEEYYAFYSSWFGGIVKNPGLMLLPIDDHIVHRGDGVFDAMKAVGRSVYLLEEHLQRLFNSAEKVALKSPLDIHQLKDVILATLKAANRKEAMIRIFLSRGPGSFSVSPYDSIAPQIYVIVTRLTVPAAEKYAHGVVIGKSIIPVKPSWMAQTKSCNYLPNVLMKKEAIDRHLDFVIGVDADGHITEGPTENIMIVDKNGVIVHPKWNHILRGETMVRVCELARENGMATAVRAISITDLQKAQEVMITGTSQNVLPVVKFEGVKIGDGKPGNISRKLNKILLNDIETGIRGTPF